MNVNGYLRRHDLEGNCCWSSRRQKNNYIRELNEMKTWLHCSHEPQPNVSYLSHTHCSVELIKAVYVSKWLYTVYSNESLHIESPSLSKNCIFNKWERVWHGIKHWRINPHHVRVSLKKILEMSKTCWHTDDAARCHGRKKKKKKTGFGSVNIFYTLNMILFFAQEENLMLKVWGLRKKNSLNFLCL